MLIGRSANATFARAVTRIGFADAKVRPSITDGDVSARITRHGQRFIYGASLRATGFRATLTRDGSDRSPSRQAQGRHGFGVTAVIPTCFIARFSIRGPAIDHVLETVSSNRRSNYTLYVGRRVTVSMGPYGRVDPAKQKLGWLHISRGRPSWLVKGFAAPFYKSKARSRPSSVSAAVTPALNGRSSVAATATHGKEA